MSIIRRSKYKTTLSGNPKTALGWFLLRVRNFIYKFKTYKPYLSPVIFIQEKNEAGLNYKIKQYLCRNSKYKLHDIQIHDKIYTAILILRKPL